MASVSRLGHVAIRVEDVDRAVGFYTGLGMRLVWKADDWCYLEAGEGRDGLALLGPGYKAAGPHFAFHFRNREEVDVVHDRLKADGVHVGPRRDAKRVRADPPIRRPAEILGQAALAARPSGPHDVRRGPLGRVLARAHVELEAALLKRALPRAERRRRRRRVAAMRLLHHDARQRRGDGNEDAVAHEAAAADGKDEKKKKGEQFAGSKRKFKRPGPPTGSNQDGSSNRARWD